MPLPTPSRRPSSTTKTNREPADLTLRARLRTTAVAFVGLASITAVAVAGVAVTTSGAAPASESQPHDDHQSHAAMGSPLADDQPAPPAAGEMVGVLDILGRPLLGADGQPLQVPLRPPSPRLPANADEVYTPDGSQPTEGSTEVDLVAAHAATLNEVANDEHYSLVQRFDLFRANGMIAPANGGSGGVEFYRGVLAAFEQQADHEPSVACTTATIASTQADGAPTDLVTGVGARQIHAEVQRVRELLDCP